MLSMTSSDFILTMAICLLVIGVITFVIGVFVIILRIIGDDVRTIATQTAKLAQKGLEEDITGLVGNASALMDSLTELTKTTAGLGVFLILVSLVLFASAYGLITLIY